MVFARFCDVLRVCRMKDQGDLIAFFGLRVFASFSRIRRLKHQGAISGLAHIMVANGFSMSFRADRQRQRGNSGRV